MKIVSFNVNGLRAIMSKDFESIFKNYDCDIFSLNETKLSTEYQDGQFIFSPQGYHVYYTNSKIRKGYSGVAVFTKIKPLNVHYGLIDHKYDDEGRVITLEFEKFYYVACYVPNAGDGLKRLEFRLQFEKDLIEYFNSLNKPIIYGGDLNCAHQEIDIKNPKGNERNAGFTIEERTAFSHLLNQGLVDIYRYLNPTTIKYSWWSYRFNARLNNAGWRIDYFLLSESLIPYVIETRIDNHILGSDHCPIFLEINL